MTGSVAAKKSSPSKGTRGKQKKSTRNAREGGKGKNAAPTASKRTRSTATRSTVKVVGKAKRKAAVSNEQVPMKATKKVRKPGVAAKSVATKSTQASKNKKATPAAGRKTSSSTKKKKVAASIGGKQKKSSTKAAATKQRGVRKDATQTKSLSTPTKARKVTSAAVGGSDAALEQKTQQEQTSPMVDPLLASPAPRSVVALLHRQQARQAAHAAPPGWANADEALQQKQRIPGAVVESTHDDGRAAGSSNGVAKSGAPSSKEAAHRVGTAPDAKPTRKQRKGPRRGRAPPIPANDLVADVLGTMEQWYVAALQAGWWQRPLDVPVVE